MATILSGRERFQTLADRYIHADFHRNAPSVQICKALIGPTRGLHICEVGAGTGDFGFELSQSEARLSFVEPAAKMRSLLAQKSHHLHNVAVLGGHAESLQLADSSCDLVISRLSARYFSNPDAFFKEAFRVLRFGGRLVLVDLISPDPLDDREAAILNAEIEYLHDPSHRTLWTQSKIAESFEGSGFQIENLIERMRENTRPLPLAEWCRLTKSGKKAEREIASRLKKASERTRKSLGFRQEADSFCLYLQLFIAIGRKVCANHETFS